MGVLEAWSYGIPCILTEGTNMIEDSTLNDAYWKTSLDIKSIVIVINKAVEDLKYNRMRHRQAAILQASKFEWDKIALNSVEAYKNNLK